MKQNKRTTQENARLVEANTPVLGSTALLAVATSPLAASIFTELCKTSTQEERNA